MQESLVNTFEACRPQLKAYILRITASVPDTEDIVQDTYLKAQQNLALFKGESSLKTWLFAIASNLAKDNLRARKRWTENVTDVCREKALGNPEFFREIMEIRSSSQQAQFEIREHIAFCLTCIAKSLPLEQQICLLLKEVHEFKLAEIATILDTTEAMVKYHLHTARQKMIDVFEHRCALINKEGVCHQCSELNGIFNPKQAFEVEKNRIQMVKMAENADKAHLFDLRMQIVRELDPFLSGAADLQLHHLEHNRKVMENFSEKNPE